MVLGGSDAFHGRTIFLRRCTTFSIFILVIDIAIGLISLGDYSNPGARYSIYVLLDAF